MASRSKAVLIAPEPAPKANSALPTVDLKIHAVFGYDGDNFGNIIYNKEGEIVYFAAGTGVIADGHGSQKYHYGHTNDIVALAVDPSKTYIATGDMCSPGNYPVIRIWNPSTGKPYVEIKGKDGNGKDGHLLNAKIEALAFSPDGNTLVGVGRESKREVTVLKTEDGWKSYKRIHNMQTTPSEIRFACFISDNEYIIGGDKVCQKLSTESTESKTIRFGDSPQDFLFCGLNVSGKIIVGTKGGRIYTIEENVLVDLGKQHNGSVNCLALYGDSYISGGDDKVINIYSDSNEKIHSLDLEEIIKEVSNVKNSFISGISAIYSFGNNIIVGTKRCNIIQFTLEDNVVSNAFMVAEGHGHGEVWGCSANPLDHDTVVSVGDDKDLFIWDINTKLPREVCHLPDRSRCIDFHPTDGLLAVGLGGRVGTSTKLDDGGFMIYNIASMAVIHHVPKMSKEWISAIKWSPDGKLLAVGSHDNITYIYDTKNKYKLLYKFNKGASFVTQFDFSEDSKLLRICYGDYQLLYCDVSNGTHYLNATDISSKTWDTDNCIIGWGVQGIWADTNDKTDINACCTNPKNTLLVAVDDMNVVRLYNYPCLSNKHQYKKFYGHASHIPYGEFTFDGNGLVTCGGNDHTVIYWDVVTK